MIFVIIGIAPLFVLAGVPSPLLAQEQSRLPIIDMHLHADRPSEEISAAGACALSA